MDFDTKKAEGAASAGLMEKMWLEQFDNEVLTATLANGSSFKKEGTADAVLLNDADIALLKGAELCHTHTTPIGGTFSADDVMITVLLKSPAHRLIATLTGEEFTLERLDCATEESAKRFADDAANIEASAQAQAREDVWLAEYAVAKLPLDAAGERKVDRVVKLVLHEWLVQNAESYGFRYSFKTSGRMLS